MDKKSKMKNEPVCPACSARAGDSDFAAVIGCEDVVEVTFTCANCAVVYYTFAGRLSLFMERADG